MDLKVRSGLTHRPDCGSSSHTDPAQLWGTWWTPWTCSSPPRRKAPLQSKTGRKHSARVKLSGSVQARGFSLTHLVDGEGALVPGEDLSGAAAGEVEELDEPGDHLVLLLRVAQAPVAAETPAEDPLLGVQHQLSTRDRVRTRVRTSAPASAGRFLTV